MAPARRAFFDSARRLNRWRWIAMAGAAVCAIGAVYNAVVALTRSCP